MDVVISPLTDAIKIREVMRNVVSENIVRKLKAKRRERVFEGHIAHVSNQYVAVVPKAVQVADKVAEHILSLVPLYQHRAERLVKGGVGVDGRTIGHGGRA